LQVGVGLTTGTLFLRSGVNRKGVTQRQGFASFTLAFLIFTSIEALPTFVNERLVFIRESSRGAHRASTFVLSKATIAIPFYLLVVLAFTITSYFLVGLVLDALAILYFVFVLFLTLYVADALVAFVASVIPDVAAGQPVVTSIVAFFYLFSGIFILR
jgi:ATP-binding cassette subfamily G (WHITE) protein 2